MFEVPKLPYSYNSLEPHIDELTMRIHHDKHHTGYVNKLNTALEQVEKYPSDISKLLANLDKLPERIRNTVRDNGGGHANHSLFWQTMTPKETKPEGELKEAINSTFGDISTFKEKFIQAALDRFASGWAWLVVDGNRLDIQSTPNQDSPYLEGKTPILGIDVWEHAYYLKYQNKRADYIKAWLNVVNWDMVGKNYLASR